MIHRGDCLDVMRGMEPNSVDAIVTDPPYYKVKNEPWDRQWDTADGFLAWIGELCEQWERILKPNGSLYCFASPKMAARVECKIGERFNVLNHIIWPKSDEATHALKYGDDRFRQYVQKSERIIFAEHYGADNMAKGEAGYGAKCDELRGFVFKPLQSWFRERIKRGGLDHRAINEAIGSCTTGGGMASHYFGDTGQYSLPTVEMYAKMRAAWPMLFDREYEYLRREYEDLRRPFSVTADVPYTDVWDFPTVSHYSGKHPCEKPLAMMRHIITASTRPGAVVLDCFMGSGVTGEACKIEGREFIGIELSQEYCTIAERRIGNVLEMGA